MTANTQETTMTDETNGSGAGERWECGPHANAWGGHDARCRKVAVEPRVVLGQVGEHVEPEPGPCRECSKSASACGRSGNFCCAPCTRSRFGTHYPATPDADEASTGASEAFPNAAEVLLCNSAGEFLSGETVWTAEAVERIVAARESAAATRARADERKRIAQAIEARRVPRRPDNTQGQIDTREALDLAARIARGDA